MSKKNVRSSQPHDLEVMRPVDYPMRRVWFVTAVIVGGLVVLFLLD